MKIIEKIKIEKFRSFGQGTKNGNEILCNELNVYSGKNNSGKSNILKALNLFFKDEVSFGEKFFFEKDYNKAYTGSYGGHIREVKITIYFSSQGDAILKNGFYIEKRFDRLGKETYKYFFKKNNDYKEAKEGRQTAQFKTFLSKLEYIYIPAVREKRFIQSIFKYFQLLLDKNKNDKKSYTDSFKNLTKLLGKRTKNLEEEFEKFIKIKTSVEAPSTITGILEGISIQTDPEISVDKKIKGARTPTKVSVDTFSSGDGIIMSYLPHFLDFLAKQLNTKKFIWGFEEPENSLEYSKVQNLSRKFSTDFVKKSQIFITTHSPAFIFLKELDNVNFYRIYKNIETDEKLSIASTIEDLEKQKTLFVQENKEEMIHILNDEINFIEFSNDTEKFVKEKLQEMEDQVLEIASLTTQLGNLTPKKIFICEDANGIEIWEKFFENYKIKDVKILSSKGCTNDTVEKWISVENQKNSIYTPKVFREIDRDGWTDEQIKFLENNLEKKNKDLSKTDKYKLSFLPVNEIENFAIISDISFTKKLIEDDISFLEDEFNGTVQSNLAQSKYRSDDLFKHSNSGVIQGKMLREAKKDSLKFFPGKEIKKLKSNFDVNNYLLNLEKNKYPQELQLYLDKIKTFFTTT